MSDADTTEQKSNQDKQSKELCEFYPTLIFGVLIGLFIFSLVLVVVGVYQESKEDNTRIVSGINYYYVEQYTGPAHWKKVQLFESLDQATAFAKSIDSRRHSSEKERIIEVTP